jgi:hypothetical protein
MTNKTGLIIGGLLLTIGGIVSFVLTIIYVLTQNSNLDYFILLPIFIVTLGINLFIKGVKTKK